MGRFCHPKDKDGWDPSDSSGQETGHLHRMAANVTYFICSKPLFLKPQLISFSSLPGETGRAGHDLSYIQLGPTGAIKISPALQSPETTDNCSEDFPGSYREEVWGSWGAYQLGGVAWDWALVKLKECPAFRDNKPFRMTPQLGDIPG